MEAESSSILDEMARYDPEGFRRRLKEVMEQRRMNQSDLARAVGLTRQGVSYWFTEKGTISIDQLLAVSVKLDVTVDYLLTGSEPKRRTDMLPERQRRWVIENFQRAAPEVQRAIYSILKSAVIERRSQSVPYPYPERRRPKR